MRAGLQPIGECSWFFLSHFWHQSSTGHKCTYGSASVSGIGFIAHSPAAGHVTRGRRMYCLHRIVGCKLYKVCRRWSVL